MWTVCGGFLSHQQLRSEELFNKSAEIKNGKAEKLVFDRLAGSYFTDGIGSR